MVIHEISHSSDSGVSHTKVSGIMNGKHFSVSRCTKQNRKFYEEPYFIISKIDGQTKVDGDVDPSLSGLILSIYKAIPEGYIPSENGPVRVYWDGDTEKLCKELGYEYQPDPRPFKGINPSAL